MLGMPVLSQNRVLIRAPPCDHSTWQTLNSIRTNWSLPLNPMSIYLSVHCLGVVRWLALSQTLNAFLISWILWT